MDDRPSHKGTWKMKLDLNSLSLKELKDLQVSVVRTISEYEDRKRREALSALEALAKENGFSLGELVGGGFPRISQTKKSSGASVAPKYCNPHNKADTWSGRGRKPLWFQAALEAGKQPEDLLIVV